MSSTLHGAGVILAAAGGSPGERAREILSATEFQRALPRVQAAPDMPDWLFRILQGLGSVVDLVLFAAGVALVLLVLYLLLRRRAARAVAAPGASPGGGTATDAVRDLEDAERLAAVGHYTEAIHLLLLAAIDRAFAGAGRTPPRAATSRELVRRLPAGTPARRAFATLVGLVEGSLFGGRELTRADWDAGRAQWDALREGA